MSPTRHVWIVMGRTGEYSDRREWLVAAFEIEARAIDERSRLLGVVRAFVPDEDGVPLEGEQFAAALHAAGDPTVPDYVYGTVDYRIECVEVRS